MHAVAVGATMLTLVTTHAPITAVAQDGSRVAWASSAGVYTKVVPGGRTRQVSTTPSVTELAVAGPRVAWVAGSRIVFAATRADVAVPRATTFTGRITAVVGRGSLLGFTVVANSTDPGTCEEDQVCTGSMTASSVGYVVRGSAIAALGGGIQPRTLLPPTPPLPRAHVPAGAQIYSTSRGALVVSGRQLFVVTARTPRLVPVGRTHGRVVGFGVAGARLVWAETLDAHDARVRAVALH